MDVTIKNQTDLKLEIVRLKGITSQQETSIKQRFNSPRAILGTITSLFKGKNAGTLTLPGKDITAWLSKFLLPLTLNKTLFRKSSFLVKSLIGLLSHKASGLVNDKTVSTLWDKVKDILPNTLVQKFSPKKDKPFYRLSSPKPKKTDN
ncbi:MAG: hypothetical protein ABIN91_00290 [Mucilaginibacter sp.]